MLRKILTLVAIVSLAVCRYCGAQIMQPEQKLVIIIPDQPVSILRAYSTDYTNKPLSAELTQRLAAERLQMLIGLSLGFKPEIVPASEKPENARRIFVGYGPHLAGIVQPPAAPEGLKIQELEGDLFLLGEIAGPGVNNWPVPADRGIMHAVETFAEQVMGFRFLHSPPEDPGLFELGTVVPKLKELAVPTGLLIEEAPVFNTRLCSATKGTKLIGLRGCSSQNFQCNHSYGMPAWQQKYAKEFPAMFLPKAEKGDDRLQETAMAQQPDLGFLDYTEPKVLEERLKHLEGWFANRDKAAFFAGRTPNDTYITEEVPDRVPGNYQYNERSRALWNEKHGRSGEFSAIWFDYLNRLAAEVSGRWPSMRIATLAYNKHYQPPVFPLSDRIDVMLTMMTSSAQNKEPEVWKHNLGMVRKWSKKLAGDRKRLLLWEYGCWPDWFHAAPMNYPFAMQKWLQAVKPHVSGVFFEMYGPVEMNFLMRRLWMSLLWNPDLDVAAEIQNLCQAFYGPAGETMTAFHRLLVERYEMPWKNPRLIWGQYYVRPANYYGESFPPEVIARLAALLDKARRQAGLPAVMTAQLRRGSAVYLLNSDSQSVPVVLSLQALEQDLALPSIGWDESFGSQRLSWNGRLRPGEKLLLDSTGKAEWQSSDGLRRDIRAEIHGRLPELAAGQSSVFHFWHRREQREDLLFRVELGCGSQPIPAAAEKNLYARRLEWVCDPCFVFQPTRNSGGDGWRGFFVDASVASRHLGRTPVYEVAAVPGLPRSIQDPVWEKLPVLELVMGLEKSAVPYEVMGYPADLPTRVRIVHAPAGLAILLTGEGKPLPEEKIVLQIQEETIEFALGPGAAAPSLLQEYMETGESWQALLLLSPEKAGLAGQPLSGRQARVQILRCRAAGAKGYGQVLRTADMENYLWSPPLALWGDGEQGPGQLLFQ